MEKEIEVPFKVGDVVWRKNRVTNKAIQTTIESYDVRVFEDGSVCILYITADHTPVVNILGKPQNTDVFATKEECDSFPPYRPY